MAYADNVRSTSKPVCWGDPKAFDPERDEECSGCRFQHSCRQEVARDERSWSYSPPSRSRPMAPRRSAVRVQRSDDADVEGEHESGIVEQGETALQRFVKDGASGAMRGMFYEFYQFWKRYRIP